MNKNYIVSEGQSLLDIAIEIYGGAAGIYKLQELNPTLDLGADLIAGQTILIHEDEPIEPIIANFFSSRSIRVNGGAIHLAESPPVEDVEAPYLLDSSPLHLSQNNGINLSLQLRFQEPVIFPAICSATAKLLKKSDLSVLATFTPGCSCVSIAGDTLSVRLPQLSYEEEYYFIADTGFVTDSIGNQWLGISQGDYRFGAAPIIYSPTPEEDEISASENPYIEYPTGAIITAGTGIAEMRVGSDPNVVVTVEYPIEDSSMIRICQNRISFLHAYQPTSPTTMVIPAGFFFVDGVPNEAITVDWYWYVADFNGDFEVAETSRIHHDGTVTNQTQWIRFNRDIGLMEEGAIEVTLDDFSGFYAPEEVIWPYNGRQDIVGVKIPDNVWVEHVPAAIYWNRNAEKVRDRAGNAATSDYILFERSKSDPIAIVDAALNQFRAQSLDVTCSGAFTAAVTISQDGNVVSTYSFTQADFPTDDALSLLLSELPGSYLVSLAVTDCIATVSNSDTIIRPLAPAPTVEMFYTGGFLVMSVDSDAPYSAGAFDAVLRITQGTTTVQTNSYDQDDLPQTLEVSQYELVHNESYSATLQVTASDGQLVSKMVNFQYDNTCSAIVWPDLSETFSSWTETGTAVRFTWAEEPSNQSLTTVLDYLQDAFPSDWQDKFDAMFKGELISPRISREEYEELVQGINEKFIGPYGTETWYLGSNSLGNSERARFIQFPDGRVFLMRRSGTWKMTIHWIEDPTKEHTLGEEYRKILFNAPPNLETGTISGNRLLTSTANTMDEVRIVSNRPGWLTYPRDTEQWVYDIETGYDFPQYRSGLGNIANIGDDRKLGGGDGNDFDPYAVMTHTNKYTNAFLLDLKEDQVVWEERVGSPGSYKWLETRYPASYQTERKFDLPASLDYSGCTVDGQFIVAAISGSGTRLLTPSGIDLGVLISTANHFDCGWFREDGVYKPCILVALTGNGNINKGIFTGMYLKDWVAIVWDVETDANTGSRSLTLRAHKVLDWAQQTAVQGGGQVSCIGIQRDFAYLAIARNNGKDDYTDYVYSDQIIEIAMNNDTSYSEAVVDEHMADRENQNVNRQPESGAGPTSLIDPSYRWSWSRGRVSSPNQNKYFVRRHWARPTDSEITNNLSN